MKPNWNDAPEWAQWLCQDSDGLWWWAEHRPRLGEFTWVAERGLIQEALTPAPAHWRETLERRRPVIDPPETD